MAERENAQLVILITRQNMDLTSWPQPSHMMGFGNEPITLTDADEFSRSCWRWCSRFNARRIERSTGLCYFLMKNNVEYILNGTALQQRPKWEHEEDKCDAKSSYMMVERPLKQCPRMLEPKTPAKRDLPTLTGRAGIRLPYLLVPV